MPPKKKAVKAEQKTSQRQTRQQFRQNNYFRQTNQKPKSKSKSKSPSPQKQTSKRKSKKSVSPPKLATPQKQVKTDDAQEEVNLVKVVMKGSIPVDQYCGVKDKTHVYQKGATLYSATLNQSNLGANNNKFYILQVLQDDKDANKFYFFSRWGRVGYEGNQAQKGPCAEQTAISDYDHKLRDKTVKGNYVQIHLNFTENTEEEKQEKTDAPKIIKRNSAPSKLHPRIQALINLIFDLKQIEHTMKEIGYDPKKMPLGKLADQTIKEGYEVLSNLQLAIQAKKGRESYMELTSKFYTLIPHDFGFQQMIKFIIDDDEKLRKKLEMLQALTDMKITTKLIQGQKNSDEDIVDQNYRNLHCKLNPIDSNSKEFKLISEYVQNTRENWKPEIIDLFEVEREGETEKYNKKIGNDMLLWHGSRISNYGGILSQGLRIAPPEAPVSGYNYGKGLYFADMAGKSFWYCRGGTSGNEILIMLCDVAVGTPNVIQKTDFNASNLPKGTDSCLGWGTHGPPESSYQKLGDVTVPLGKPQRTKSGHYMEHNEYIVYKTEQARIHYLLRIKL